MKQLFDNYNYDRTVRPRRNSSETVTVDVRFNLQQINDMVSELFDVSVLIPLMTVAIIIIIIIIIITVNFKHSE